MKKKKPKQFSAETKINDLHEIGRVFKLAAEEFRAMYYDRDREHLKTIALNFDKISTLCVKIDLPPLPEPEETTPETSEVKIEQLAKSM